VPDFKSHRFKLATHLMVPKAQHLDSLLGEELVSLLVSGTLVGETVSASVEFHCKLRQRAVEIEVVDAARILATELEFTEATVAEQAPQTFLGISASLAGWRAKSRAAAVRVRCLPYCGSRALTLTLSPAGGEGISRASPLLFVTIFRLDSQFFAEQRIYFVLDGYVHLGQRPHLCPSPSTRYSTASPGNGAWNDREDDPAVIGFWEIVSPLSGLNHSTVNFRELGMADRSIVNEPP